MEITFDGRDLAEENHHDSLVISLHISNCLMTRVMVDNGSSANIIFKDALDSMGLREADIIKTPKVLVGFSGETKHTLGEVNLVTSAAGINMTSRFNVVDCPSAYNVILGTSWIHKTKVIPSTYHQVIKFPSPWGVLAIEGDRKIVRDCYKRTLKPKPSSI